MAACGYSAILTVEQFISLEAAFTPGVRTAASWADAAGMGGWDRRTIINKN